MADVTPGLLRKVAGYIFSPDTVCGWRFDLLLHGAADEIERLRDALTEARRDGDERARNMIPAERKDK